MGVVTRDQCPAAPPLLSPSAQRARSLRPLPPGTHQAAAEVHQAKLRKSAMVGCGGERGMGCHGCPWTRISPPYSLVRGGASSVGRSPSAPPPPPGITGAHHKDAPGCSTQVAWRLGGAGCLIVVGLFAGVEGVIVECQHQVGIHLTEEPAHLGMPGGSGSHRAGSAAPPEGSNPGPPPSSLFSALTWSH